MSNAVIFNKIQEKIQEIGTTEKAWIEYAQAIDRNNENIRIALDGIIRKEVLQSTMKRIAIYVPFPNMKLPIFLKVQCASPTVPVFNIYYNCLLYTSPSPRDS